MTLRIGRSAYGKTVVLALSGRIEGEHVEEMKRLLSLEPGNHSMVLNLKDLTLVDEDGVRFLAGCEDHGWELAECPAYVREWMAREREQGNQRQQLTDGESKIPAVNAKNEDEGGFDVRR